MVRDASRSLEIAAKLSISSHRVAGPIGFPVQVGCSWLLNIRAAAGEY